MKPVKALAFLALAASCVPTAPIMYGYRPDTTIAQKDKDGFDCQLQAAREVPVNSQIRTTPSYVTPMQTNCYGTSCYTTGGQVIGGNTYSYDANAALRNEYFARCMVSRGYQFTQQPLCSKDQVTDALRNQLSGDLRAPAEGSCVVPITNKASNLAYRGEVTP